MDFEDEYLEDEVEFSNTQEYAQCFPQEKFLVTYVKDDPYERVTVFASNAAEAGALVSKYQGQGIDTVELFKLEEYPIARALAVHDKKQRRARRRGTRKEG